MMKRTGIIVALAVFAGMTLSSMMSSVTAQAPSQAKPSAVAVINSEEVFSGLAEKGAMDADVQSQIDQLKETKDQKDQELNALKSDLELFDPGSPQHEAKLLELEEKATQFQAWATFQQKKVALIQQKKSQELSKKIVEAIDAYCKEAGIDLVINQRSTIQVPSSSGSASAQRVQIALYVGESVDITDEIIQKMNNEYNNRP